MSRTSRRKNNDQIQTEKEVRNRKIGIHQKTPRCSKKVLLRQFDINNDEELDDELYDDI